VRFADVEASKLLFRQGDYFKFYLRLRRTKAFVTAYYNTIQECAYFIHDQRRASSRSIAIRIAEIDNPGTPEEREKIPQHRDFSGLVSWWHFENQRRRNIELESASSAGIFRPDQLHTQSAIYPGRP
jgi:hypothetical protein